MPSPAGWNPATAIHAQTINQPSRSNNHETQTTPNDADGNVVDIIWLELGEDMFRTLSPRDKETVLRRAEVLLEILHLTRLR